MDNFDALQTIKGFEKYRETTDRVELNDTVVERDNYVDWNIGKGISWDWECEYTVKKDGDVIERFTDEQVLSSFIESEIDYFFEEKGFNTIEFNKDKFLHIAEKVSDMWNLVGNDEDIIFLKKYITYVEDISDEGL